MMKKFIAVLLLLMLGAGNAWSAAPEAAQELVKETAEEMLEALREHEEALEEDPGLIYDLVRDIAVRHFDFETMSRWVLGRHWREATSEQQGRFVEEFRTLLIRTYATTLLEYPDAEIHYLPLRAPEDAEDMTVRTEVRPPAESAISIDFSMHLTEDGWKVYNVTVDGISLVTTHRSTFTTKVRQEGLDALIDTLKERNRQAAR